MAIKYNSNFHDTIPFSDVSVPIGLSTNNEQTYTVPGDPTQKFQALFSYNSTSNVFVRRNATATVPSLNSATLVQYEDFRPHKRYVQGGDVLHFITPDASAYVGLHIMQIPG